MLTHPSSEQLFRYARNYHFMHYRHGQGRRHLGFALSSGFIALIGALTLYSAYLNRRTANDLFSDFALTFATSVVSLNYSGRVATDLRASRRFAAEALTHATTREEVVAFFAERHPESVDF